MPIEIGVPNLGLCPCCHDRMLTASHLRSCRVGRPKKWRLLYEQATKGFLRRLDQLAQVEEIRPQCAGSKVGITYKNGHNSTPYIIRT